MGDNENKPINGDPAHAAMPSPPPAAKFNDQVLRECRPYADKIVLASEGLTPSVAVAGSALALAMLARVGSVPPFQAWKLFDFWMRILGDAEKPMAAPRTSLLAYRTVVDEIEDRLRHLIVCCAHRLDLNADDVRAVIKGLAETELERIQRAKGLVLPTGGAQ